MKRRLLRGLAALLLVSMLPALACLPKAEASAKAGLRLMYVGTSVKLGSKLGGAPVSRIRFKSSKPNVAKVSGGRIRARSAGCAMISASFGGRTAYCGVVAIPRKLRVKVGASVKLPHAGGEKYRVENKSVARVSSTGRISGRKRGSTRVIVSCGVQKLVVKLTVAGGKVKQSAAAGLDCADSAKQIVLVDYQGDSRAKLSVHEKKSGVWKQLYSCTAYVGRNGIGKTREGDGKTPTGTYNLTQPFGIKSDPGSNMGYTKVTKYHYWCGSSNSKYYNRLVDERKVNRKHSSSDEYLINYKGVYNYCMFIDYNASGKAGKGSCIFLHCKGSKNSTAGCIAVSEAAMKKIIQWAKPGCKIVIR